MQTSLHAVKDPSVSFLQDTGGAAPSTTPGAELRGGCWDPKDDNRVVVAADNGFQVRLCEHKVPAELIWCC